MSELVTRASDRVENEFERRRAFLERNVALTKKWIVTLNTYGTFEKDMRDTVRGAFDRRDTKFEREMQTKRAQLVKIYTDESKLKRTRDAASRTRAAISDLNRRPIMVRIARALGVQRRSSTRDPEVLLLEAQLDALVQDERAIASQANAMADVEIANLRRRHADTVSARASEAASGAVRAARAEAEELRGALRVAERSIAKAKADLQKQMAEFERRRLQNARIAEETVKWVKQFDAAYEKLKAEVGWADLSQTSPTFARALSKWLLGESENGAPKKEGISACAGSKVNSLVPGAAFAPVPYQKRTAAVIGNPYFRGRILCFHGMGSGKTTVMALAVQKMARKCADEAYPKGPLTGTLILVQDESVMKQYRETVKRTWFLGADFALSPEISNAGIRTFVITFKRKDVLRVVVGRMTVAMRLRFEKWRDGLPARGAVFVDEPQNMFDTSEMKTNKTRNHAGAYVEAMAARPDLGVHLFSGTPVLNIESTQALDALVKFLAPHLHFSTRKFFHGGNWLEGKKKEFIDGIGGHVSYVNTESDRTVFPRIVMEYGGRHVDALDFEDGLKETQPRLKPNLNVPYIPVYVPFGSLLKKKEAERRGEALTGLSFQGFSVDGKMDVPQKWRALKAAVEGVDAKHFAFIPKSSLRYTGESFAKWLETQNWRRHVPGKKASPSSHPKFIVLAGDADDIAAGVRDFNDASLGIKLAIGGLQVKEGITLKSTNYVHVIEPPSSRGTLDQVIRRAVRYCAHEALDYAYWKVSVLIYVTVGRDFEKSRLKALKSSGNPVELALEAMKVAAFDCEANGYQWCEGSGASEDGDAYGLWGAVTRALLLKDGVTPSEDGEMIPSAREMSQSPIASIAMWGPAEKSGVLSHIEKLRRKSAERETYDKKASDFISQAPKRAGGRLSYVVPDWYENEIEMARNAAAGESVSDKIRGRIARI